jgi:large subunit ribosomal protein L5e
MDNMYKGVETVTGEEYNVEDVDCERRPFKAVLDVGIRSTTTGNRVFGCLKGAIDGGLLIPYSEKRFPGYAEGEDKGEGNYDAGVHRERIFGVHVDKYMKDLKGEAEDYKK